MQPIVNESVSIESWSYFAVSSVCTAKMTISASENSVARHFRDSEGRSLPRIFLLSDGGIKTIFKP